MSNSVVNQIFESLSKQNISIKEDNQLLHLICHNFLKKAGYRCMYEEPSSIPGFAQAIKPIPSNCFVPPNWNPEELQFRYTHYRNSSLKYELLTFKEDEKNIRICIFIEPSGINHSLNISIQEYFDDSKPINERIVKESELIDKITDFISVIPQIENDTTGEAGPKPQLPQYNTAHLPRPSNPTNVPNIHNDSTQQQQPYNPSSINPQINPSTGRFEFTNTPQQNHPFGGDFSGDLNPFSNGPMGNLVGPDYFRRQQQQHNLPDGVPLGARFDPFDPLHPNGPFQKKGKPSLFGIPDPDHLKPPRGGPNDNNDFGFGF